MIERISKAKRPLKWANLALFTAAFAFVLTTLFAPHAPSVPRPDGADAPVIESSKIGSFSYLQKVLAASLCAPGAGQDGSNGAAPCFHCSGCPFSSFSCAISAALLFVLTATLSLYALRRAVRVPSAGFLSLSAIRAPPLS